MDKLLWALQQEKTGEVSHATVMRLASQVLVRATSYCDEVWGVIENDPESTLTREQKKAESEIWQTAASNLCSFAAELELEYRTALTR